MIHPLLICLAIFSPSSASHRISATEVNEYLHYRNWSGQHWRISASEPTKLLIQHMPDERKVSEEKTIDVIQYKTGSGAKYTATIEERTEKGLKSFILRHVSENGKDNHLDTHISYIGWDNKPHVAEIVGKDGKILWNLTNQAASGTATVAPEAKKPSAVRPVQPVKTKTGG